MFENRRSFFRCPVGSELADAVLQCRAGQFAVELVEQSAGGFGLVASKPIPVCEGEPVLLKSKQGAFETVVVHNSTTDEGCRIGLRRLSEITVTPAGRVKAFPEKNGTRFPIAVLALCVAFFGSGIAVPMLMGQSDEAITLTTSPDSGRLTKSVLLLQDLKSTQFMRDLKLNDSQRQQIAAAVDEAVVNLTALFQNQQRMSDDERAAVGLQLLSKAWQRIQATLTAEQREHWNQLLANSASQKPGLLD